MLWYIARREQGPVADKWPCLVQFCNKEFENFQDMIGHLDNKCPQFKPSARQYTYTCPACGQDIQVSDIGYGKKTLGKIKKSIEDIWSHSNVLGRPLSATSSHTLATQVSPASVEDGPFEIYDQDFCLVSPKENSRNVPIYPINTKISPISTYGAFPSDICPSSLTSSSPSWSAPYSAISQCFSPGTSLLTQPTEPSSAVVLTPASNLGASNIPQCWSNTQLPHGLGQAASLNYDTHFADISADNLNLIHAVTPMDDITPSLLMDSNGFQAQLQAELQGQFQGDFQKLLHDYWSQRGEFSQYSPMDSPKDDGFFMEVAGSDAPTSPGPSSSTTSEAPLSPAHSSTPECKQCEWKPEAGVRSMKRMKQAVQKHIKRNHESRDYKCPVCDQPFKNRPDNVKPHVFRKHRLLFDSIYPKTVQDGYRDEKKDKTTGAVPNRRASVPPYISHSLPRQRRRLQRRSC